MGQVEKGVVLFSGFAGKRLEPVRKVGASFFFGPFFHTYCPTSSATTRQFLAALDGGFDVMVHFLASIFSWPRH